MKSKNHKSSNFKRVLFTALIFMCIGGAGFAQATQNIGVSGYKDTPNSISDNDNISEGITALKAYYAAGMINISFNKPASENVIIQVFDITGRIIINDVAPCLELKTARTYSVKSLSNGIYIVQVSSSSQVFSRKFFV